MYGYLYLPELESASENTSLSTIYRVPDPLESEEQWDIYRHRDVRVMSEVRLRLSRVWLEMRLSGETHPHPWLLERLEVLNRGLDHER